MNHIHMKFRKVAGEQEPTILEVSVNFESQLIEFVKEQTSLDIDLIRAEKTRFFDSKDGTEMIRYTMDLSREKIEEFGDFARMLYSRLYSLIHHNQN